MADQEQAEDLPGIGRRYRLAGDGGEELTLVVHHTGRRDLYIRGEDGGESSIRLTEPQAEELAGLLTGGGIDAVLTDADRLSRLFGVDRLELIPGSPLTDRSLREFTSDDDHITLLVVMRQGRTVEDPDDTMVLRSGDRLVVAGRKDRLAHFRRAAV